VEKVYNYQLIEKLQKETPTLAIVSADKDVFMEDFHRAGGVSAVMGELRGLGLLEACKNIYNLTLSSFYKESRSMDEAVIFPGASPISKQGAISVLYGSLAEDGCLIRSSCMDQEIKVFKGEAKVFNNEEDAIFALTSDGVKDKDVIVVRHQGLKGAPGMRDMSAVVATINAVGLKNRVALVTDGRVGGTSTGIVIGHVSPEAFEGSNLALVENGDIININFTRERINLEVPAKDLKTRKRRLKPQLGIEKGMLKRYSKRVSSSSKGAVLED